MVGCKKDPVTDMVYVLDSWNPGPRESRIANYHKIPEQSLYTQNSVCEWADIVHLSNSFNNIRPALSTVILLFRFGHLISALSDRDFKLNPYAAYKIYKHYSGLSISPVHHW